MKRSLALLVLIGLALSLSAVVHAQEPIQVNIGHQRGLTTLLIEWGTIEERLGDDYVVNWFPFPAGPQLFEALNAGQVDYGASGDTPPIFAQAAGVPFQYIAANDPSGLSLRLAIIVPEDSEIETLEDLRGRSVALAFASGAQYFLIRALQEAGLTYEDIEPVNLLPADARPAFEGGNVDAWVAWDPALYQVLEETDARILYDALEVGGSQNFHFASTRLLEENPEVATVIVQEYQRALEYTRANLDLYSEQREEETGIPAETWRAIFEYQTPGDLGPVTEEIVEEQQRVADVFFDLGQIPEQLDIASIVYEDNAAIWEDFEYGLGAEYSADGPSS
jgi:sulfonate transport system substrate-binding protein